MAGHIRKFITSPLPIFELDFAPGTRVPPPLIAAAKSLALCIDVSFCRMVQLCLLTSLSVGSRRRSGSVVYVLAPQLHRRYQQGYVRHYSFNGIIPRGRRRSANDTLNGRWSTRTD